MKKEIETNDKFSENFLELVGYTQKLALFTDMLEILWGITYNFFKQSGEVIGILYTNQGGYFPDRQVFGLEQM